MQIPQAFQNLCPEAAGGSRQAGGPEGAGRPEDNKGLSVLEFKNFKIRPQWANYFSARKGVIPSLNQEDGPLLSLPADRLTSVIEDLWSQLVCKCQT